MAIAALATGVPVSETFTGTGTVAGTRFGTPLGKTGERFVQINVKFSADPGAYVFEVQAASTDLFYGTVQQITGSDATNKVVKVAGYQIMRIAQISKTNSVTATVTVTLL